MSKKPRRTGLVAMLAVVAIVATAAIVAQAGSDPAQLECSDRYAAVGEVEPSNAYKTPAEAAAAFAADMEADGKPLPVDAELVELAGSGTMRIAARVDGRTQIILELAQSDSGWSVQGFTAC